MTTPETQPATPTTKTYDFTKTIVHIGGMPLEDFPKYVLAFEYLVREPARTPDDVRNYPRPGDAYYFPDGVGSDGLYVVVYSLIGSDVHYVGLGPDGWRSVGSTSALSWALDAVGGNYVPRDRAPKWSDDGKTWELFPGPRPAAVVLTAGGSL